jgi:hypothetical protein
VLAANRINLRIGEPLNTRRSAALIAATCLAIVATSGAAYAATAEATYEMNEAAGVTVMTDSSGNRLNGRIDQDGLDTGFMFAGGTGYHWDRKGPNSLPVAPERIVQVADNDHLDPRSDTFTVSIRFRTQENFGNIIQKGQATTRGGQWKIQNPQGRPSCLFKGSQGRTATRATRAINDNAWHVLTCTRTATRVTLSIDGQVNNWQNGATGIINNSKNLSIAGKTNCDQVRVTCDYFSGEMDWIRITRG